MKKITEQYKNTLEIKNLSFEHKQKFMFKKIFGCLSTIILLLVIGSQATQTFAQTCSTAPADLVSWYQGEDNALDFLGRNNGTIQGNVTFTNGYVGRTFTLGGNGNSSGNGDRVLVGNPANLQLQNFTIEAWVKRSSNTIVTNSPVGGFEGGTFFAYGINGYGFVIQQATNRIGLTNIGASAVYSTSTITDTNFHHVAVTKSGNQVTFYIDGVADAPITYNTTFAFTTNAAIGARGDNDARNAFFGSIDELSIYNRVLTAAEIQAIVTAATAGKCIMNTLTVTNTNDSGAGSLRQAIIDANATGTDDIIGFSSLFNTPQTITLTSGVLGAVNNAGVLVISGPGANLLTINGNNQSSIFTTFNLGTSPITIRGMTMTGGNGTNTQVNGRGGAIYNTVNLTLANVVITGNTASLGGGINNVGAALSITNSTISNNTSTGDGGGIRTDSAELTVTNSTINGNTTATYGGGFSINDGSLFSISNSIVNNNKANGGNGGAMNLDRIAVSNITDTTVNGNTSSANGGGLSLNRIVNVTNSTLSNNVSNTGGGGVASFGIFTLTNSTLSGNISNGGGGGIQLFGGGITFLSSTIVNNSATTNGGGISGSSTLRNTLIGNNSAGGAGPDVNGSITSQGYNLIQNTSGATITGTTTGNITGVDPQIDPILRNNNTANGTKTHALRLTSPAINAGDPANPSSTDQRGKPRPVGASSDIGAYERQTDDYIPLAIFEFDGDGRSDISVFRSTNSGATGTWYINRSTGGFTGVQFGAGTDLIAPSDFDGDGKTDITVFRPSNGTWYYIRSSTNTFVGIQFGQNGDLPRPADYDGDDKADIAVFRPSNGAWYRINSSDGQIFGTQFGQAGDLAIPGDYDGDGKANLAVFRPSNGFWYIARPTGIASQNFIAIQFGLATDIPTPMDFDGDSKPDIAVFRPSNGFWYRINSTDGRFVAFQFGQNGDIPVAADYDRDGKADYAVFRNGVWFYSRSTDGGFVAISFGAATDKPVPAAF